jgi:hypothetical protein
VPVTVGGAGFSGCNVLDQDGIDRITGLGSILPAPTAPLVPVEAISAMGACPLSGPVWGDGNILLGGLGSDTLEGRGANDVIDGDRYLRVRISVRDARGTEIGTADLMERTYQAGNTRTLAADVAAGVIDPGHLVAVREIITPTPAQSAGNVDSAVFSGPTANYTVTTSGGNGTLGSAGSVTTVVDNVGTDGTDTVRNIERLVFSDTVIPSTPAIGLAVAGNAQATVSWTASTVGIPTSYSVKVVDSAGAQLGVLRTVLGGQTSLTVTGLTNGTAYRLQVSATNAEGTSAFSAPSNAVTPTAPVVPVIAGAPTLGAIVAGNAQVTVNWLAPAPVANAAPITGYAIRTFAGTTLVRTTIVGNVTNIVITALTNGTGYTFDVAAINSVGTGVTSARSAVATPAAPIVVPGAPTIGTPTAGVASATVNWTASSNNGGSAITGYRVRAFAGATLARTQTVTGNLASVAVTGLTNGTAYTFDVAATNAAGTGAASGRSLAVTPRTEFVAPTVTARSPISGGRSVSQTGNITVTFSEPVVGVSGTTFTLRLGSSATGQLIAAVVTYNATTRVATLDPTATLLADRTYTARLSGVTDVAGNTMTAASWGFIVGPAPTITASTPASGATAVGRNANATATFSEAITGDNSATVRITQVSNGAVVAAVNTFNTTTRVLTIDPSASLAANTQYRVTITGGNASVRDLAGNPVTTRTWVFTTGTAF